PVDRAVGRVHSVDAHEIRTCPLPVNIEATGRSWSKNWLVIASRSRVQECELNVAPTVDGQVFNGPLVNRGSQRRACGLDLRVRYQDIERFCKGTDFQTNRQLRLLTHC